MINNPIKFNINKKILKNQKNQVKSKINQQKNK